jgi:hypothetical protein
MKIIFAAKENGKSFGFARQHNLIILILIIRVIKKLFLQLLLDSV